MTTFTANSMSKHRSTRAVSPITRVGFGRAVLIELRKATNTVAARSLLIASCGVSLAAMLIMMFVNLGDQVAGSIPMYLQFSVIFCQILLPLCAVMLVTSEWSQRTGVVTFTLEPRRGLVIFAKLMASVILAIVIPVVLGAVCLAFIAITQLSSGETADWDKWYIAVGSNMLVQLIWVLIGFALASLFLNTPAAIVGFFVVQVIIPVIFQLLSAVDALKDALPWFDAATALNNLGSGRLFGYWKAPDFDAAEGWAHLVCALAVWLVLPLVLGLIRVLRAEIK